MKTLRILCKFVLTQNKYILELYAHMRILLYSAIYRLFYFRHLFLHNVTFNRVLLLDEFAYRLSNCIKNTYE